MKAIILTAALLLQSCATLHEVSATFACDSADTLYMGIQIDGQLYTQVVGHCDGSRAILGPPRKEPGV